ncbi:MAG: hypothetical protein A2Y39_07050 [Candidatus Delongbacteria bacterium GWF2_40_14]|nr:MAG: hypothetical protein A2Y39_07050 [Candidatus Delongbacteria bacterium GWF2_40_14]
MKILYKYMEQPFELFKKGYIRATQLSAINDPFEASYSEEGLKNLESEFEDINLNGELSLKDYIENNKNKIGIISFSESKDNLLMWAHYAKEHKGLVAGFIFPPREWKYSKFFEHLFLLPTPPSTGCDDKNNFFNGEIKPVIYRKQQRYKIDGFDFDYSNISDEGADRILFEIFLQKSEEWIYEKEHRIVLRLEQADKVYVNDIKKIKNKKLLANIIESKCCKKKFDDDKEYHEVNLSKIAEKSKRMVFAKALAELSMNPKNIYLFKLASNSIYNCIFGIKCKYNKRNCANNANKINSFKVSRVKKNNENYILDFS